MTRDLDDPMEAEFDTVAEWTARVAASLGPEYYIPAACRGSGQPAVLDWLLERLGPRPGEVMIDVGAGLGGPAVYAAHRTGVQPVLVEPEPDACRAAARLFGAPIVQADATALPFGGATVREGAGCPDLGKHPFRLIQRATMACRNPAPSMGARAPCVQLPPAGPEDSSPSRTTYQRWPARHAHAKVLESALCR
jgi:hypothetical protein